MIVAAIAVVAFGAECMPLQAADLGPIGETRIRSTRHFADPCSWHGHLCLYAFDGYVYHYPWHTTRYGSYARGYRAVVRARY